MMSSNCRAARPDFNAPPLPLFWNLKLTCVQDVLNLKNYLCALDPQSGIPLEVIARFQANILIEPSKELHMFSHFKKPIFIPAFWFETKMALPDNLVFQMWALSNLQTMFRITGYTLFGLATGAFVVIAIYFKVGVLEQRRKGPVLVEEERSTSPIVDSSTSSHSSHDSALPDDDGDEAPILR